MGKFYYVTDSCVIILTWHGRFFSQTTGEAVYVDDIPAYPGQLEAAFVLSTVGNAKLSSIDASEALVCWTSTFSCVWIYQWRAT